MLESAIAGFVDGIATERDFDVPLRALLHCHGFFDVHFLHGRTEFGKDFVAKRSDADGLRQYVIQTKCGDVTQSRWSTEVQPQCETMGYADSGHPGLDGTLPRVRVFCTTGTLKSGAHDLFDQYQLNSAQRGLGELELWDRDKLIEMLTAESCLAGRTDWVGLGAAVFRMATGEDGVEGVEMLSRRWCAAEDASALWVYVLEACVARDELRRRSLGVHAVMCAYAVVRAACEVAARGQIDSRQRDEVVRLAGEEALHLTHAIVEPLVAVVPDDLVPVLFADDEFPLFAVAARAAFVIELGANAAFTASALDPKARSEFGSIIEKVAGMPVARQPLGDRFALSVLAGSIALAATDATSEAYLRDVARWVLRHHENDGLGLAGPSAAPKEELFRTAGHQIAMKGIEKRHQSYVAAAVLDACSVLGLRGLYDDAIHDFEAEEVIPTRLLPVPGPDELNPDGRGCESAFAGDFASSWQGRDGWKNAYLHDRTCAPRWFDECGWSWVGAVLSSLYRDRWWIESYRRLALTNVVRKSATVE